MFPELKRLIEQMGKDRGIDREIIVKALEDAMLTAARKKLGPDVELEAHYNEEAGSVWMQRVITTYPSCVWLNPVAEREWDMTASIPMLLPSWRVRL